MRGSIGGLHHAREAHEESRPLVSAWVKYVRRKPIKAANGRSTGDMNADL